MRATATLLKVPQFLAVSKNGVFDSVPQGTPYPYTKVTATELPLLETFGALGFQVEMRLQMYSAAEDTEELDQMVAAAVALLHHASPAMDGWVVPQINYLGFVERPEVLIENVRVKHRVASFQWLVAQS
jgi:hypothetical protein